MKRGQNLFFKSLKYFGFTMLLMFMAPFVVYQAFKNQEHPLYIPVLIMGLVMGISAISLGFYSIKLLMDFIFNRKK